MKRHRRAVAAGQDEACGLAFFGADGAKDVGRVGALIARRTGPCAASGPAAGDLVLLADPRLVLEPDFYPCGPSLPGDLGQARGEVFLNAAARTRSGHDAAAGQRACGSPWPAAPGSASAWRWRSGTPRRSIAPGRSAASARRHGPPGSGRSRPSRAAPVGASSLSRGGVPGALPSIRPSGPSALNAQHPVPHDLQPDPADARRIAAIAAVIDHGQSQQAAGLIGIPRTPAPEARNRAASKSSRSAIAAAMANLLPFAMVNQISRRFVNLEASVRSRDTGVGRRRDRDLIEAGLSEPAGWRSRLWGLCRCRLVREPPSPVLGGNLGRLMGSGGGDCGRQSRAATVVLIAVAANPATCRIGALTTNGTVPAGAIGVRWRKSGAAG